MTLPTALANPVVSCSMKVRAGQVVRIDCELKIKGGEVIESSAKTGPVEYTHGAGQMLAGLEKQLDGMAAGDERSGVIPATEAFGTPETQPTMKLPRSSFPPDAKMEVGQRFEAKGPTGTPVTLDIRSIDGDAITARVVHPLAGKDVEFRVKVVSVRPPVPKSKPVEELDVKEDGQS